MQRTVHHLSSDDGPFEIYLTSTEMIIQAKSNTKFMLQEIQTRLAIQHDKLSLFSKSIEDYTKVAKIEGERVQRDLNNLLQLHQNS